MLLKTRDISIILLLMSKTFNLISKQSFQSSNNSNNNSMGQTMVMRMKSWRQFWLSRCLLLNWKRKRGKAQPLSKGKSRRSLHQTKAKVWCRSKRNLRVAHKPKRITSWSAWNKWTSIRKDKLQTESNTIQICFDLLHSKWNLTRETSKNKSPLTTYCRCELLTFIHH